MTICEKLWALVVNKNMFFKKYFFGKNLAKEVVKNALFWQTLQTAKPIFYQYINICIFLSEYKKYKCRPNLFDAMKSKQANRKMK